MGSVNTVTLDLRVRVPYKEEVVSNMELHTFEHCFATAVRNITDNMDNVAVAYFGPMGCQTGYYLVLNTTESKEKYFDIFYDILKKSCDYVEAMTEVPAKNELQCGNCYSLGDIADAKRAGKDLAALVPADARKRAESEGRPVRSVNSGEFLHAIRARLESAQ